MRFVIVTGMSGGGKSTVLKMLEDAGFYCVDNLPISLVEKFVELISMPNSEVSKVVLGLDVRSDQSFKDATRVLETLKKKGYQFEILFVDADENVLIKRYKETRRVHPLAPDGRVEENEEYNSLMVTVMSFGFKYGIPADADLVFDVRFLPNPFYIDELKHKTGNDKEVQDYVMNNEEATAFMDKLTDMIQFLIPNYVKEGKYRLVIAIGCTGGKHRSVTLANELFKRMRDTGNYGIKLYHRDVDSRTI